MRRFSFAHVETGLFNGQHYSTSDESLISLNTPADHVAILGAFDCLSERIDWESGEIVDWQPPQPSGDHEWNEGKRRWVVSAAAAEKGERQQRARTRIDELRAESIDVLRELALGYESARQHLQAIDEEIAKLRADL